MSHCQRANSGHLHIWKTTYHWLLLLAEEKKTLAEDKANEIEEQTKLLAVEKQEAESSLAEALPALAAARNALQDLEKSDVADIRYDLLLPKNIIFIFCC